MALALFTGCASQDIILNAPPKPFMDAGLDPAKPDAGYRADDTTLYLAADFGEGSTFALSLPVDEMMRIDSKIYCITRKTPVNGRFCVSCCSLNFDR